MKIDFSMFEKIGFNTVRSVEKCVILYSQVFTVKIKSNREPEA